MRDLLVIVPSRGRPERLADALREGLEQSTAETDYIVGYDNDDPCYGAYGRLQKDFGQRVLWSPGPRKGLSGWTNYLAEHYQQFYSHLASFGDDHLARTEGWDTKLLAAIDEMGGSGFSYPNDLQRPDIPEAVVVSTDIVKALGWFCLPELKHWCVVPETPVLTADLCWVPIGKLSVGDELVGVDEWPVAPRVSRAYRRAKVQVLQRRVARCVAVELEDGREVTCSVDHPWLALRRWMGKGQQGPGRYEWRESLLLQPGDLLVSPFRVWGEETGFDAGWLSGVFDGEGTLCRFVSSGCAAVTLTVAQNPGAVLSRIEGVLGAMDIGYRRRKKSAGNHYSPAYKCEVLEITPRSTAIELLGRIHPVRFDASLLWEDMSNQPKKVLYGTVKSVRLVEDAEVVSMKTSTGTYIANGLVAHNCVDNVWADLGSAIGRLKFCPEVVVEHMHWSRGVAPRDYTYRQAAAGTERDLRAYTRWCATRRDADVAVVKKALGL